jgi:spermidine synthase
MGLLKLFPRRRGVKERFRHQDERFGTVVVSDRGEIRTLQFGNHIKQGAMDLKRPDRVHLHYQRVMLEVFVSGSYPRCLCLGLGAGSIPKYIAQQGLCQRIEVVELNPVVIDVARTFFGLPETVRVHQRDAMEFVELSSMQYDLIMVDLFDSEGTPLQFKRVSFYQKLFGLLRSGGIVVVNMWAADFGDLLLEQKLRSVFDQVEVMQAERNHITLCRRLK